MVWSNAADAEKGKERSHSPFSDLYILVPSGFETFGPWGLGAYNLINEIQKRLAKRTGDARSVCFLRQPISVEIQRGDAASAIGTVPSALGLGKFLSLLHFTNGIQSVVEKNSNSDMFKSFGEITQGKYIQHVEGGAVYIKCCGHVQ